MFFYCILKLVQVYDCLMYDTTLIIIVESLDALKAKKTLIRNKLGHTMVLAIKALSVTQKIWQKEPEENTVNLQF